MNNTAIIYRRVSTVRQDQHGYSLDDQEGVGRAYCARKGLQVQSVITEGNETHRFDSGAAWKREGLRLIREAVDNGAHHIVICFPDRLARDFALAVVLMDEMQRRGVAVHDVSTDRILWADEDRKLDDVLAFWKADEDRRLTAERMYRGKLAKLRSGKPASANEPYGYRFVGSKRDLRVEIDEEEAKIVRLIYQWYVHGEDGKPMSALAITKRLSELCVPTRRDRTGGLKLRGYGSWDSSSVYAILREETYTGVKYENRYDTTSGRQVVRPRAEWIAIPVPVIIPRSLWQVAQNRRAAQRELRRPSSRRYYPISGRLRCACGFSASGMTRGQGRIRCYRCISRNQTTGACGAPPFNAHRVEIAVVEWLQAECENDDTLKTGVARLNQVTYEEQAKLEAICATLEKHRTDLLYRSQRWKDAYEAGIIGLAELKERLASLHGPITSLESQIATHKAELDASKLNKRDVDLLRTLVAQLHTPDHEWQAEADRQLRLILDRFDVRITLAVEEREKVAYLTSRFIPEGRIVRLVVGVAR